MKRFEKLYFTSISKIIKKRHFLWASFLWGLMGCSSLSLCLNLALHFGTALNLSIFSNEAAYNE